MHDDMKNFVLRDVDDTIWNKFSERSKREGWPNARTIIVKLLEDYGDGKTNPSSPAPKN